MLEKEKLLISVFKSLLLKARKNQGLFEKGLNVYRRECFWFYSSSEICMIVLLGYLRKGKF